MTSAAESITDSLRSGSSIDGSGGTKCSNRNERSRKEAYRDVGLYEANLVYGPIQIEMCYRSMGNMIIGISITTQMYNLTPIIYKSKEDMHMRHRRGML
ncbi:hypothetical protein O6P43_022078 [Quillaja saponaria]|uniref:Uncharacterized protein n=1 Tax=Quillaja saponaria TaxID=32244 RepID=A0AAD7PH96_QUISA|nr:hypothetical protein O6P43_022078 [Quillaja saponaria]